MTFDLRQTLEGRPFFCSWSGGKDSCLALYRAVQIGGMPGALLTMLSEDGEKSRSHGLPRSLIERQAESLGIRPFFRSASWDEYEAEFISAIRELKGMGIEIGVFGDIDLEPHLEWVRRVCETAGIRAVHPLWHNERNKLLSEFIDAGFVAKVVAVNENKLNDRFLGMTIDPSTLSKMEQAGIDLCGELGEYHTVVIDGPIFSSRVEIRHLGIQRHSGYRFLQVGL